MTSLERVEFASSSNTRTNLAIRGRRNQGPRTVSGQIEPNALIKYYDSNQARLLAALLIHPIPLEMTCERDRKSNGVICDTSSVTILLEPEMRAAYKGWWYRCFRGDENGISDKGIRLICPNSGAG